MGFIWVENQLHRLFVLSVFFLDVTLLFFTYFVFLSMFCGLIAIYFAFPDDEGGNVKPVPLNGKAKNSHDELQVRLGFFLQNNARRNGRSSAPSAQSCSSLASANTSPVSTLTGSSEADMSRVLQESSAYHHMGCDSIGSLMSVSMSGNSNGSASPLSRRHSVTSKYFILFILL